MYFYGEKVSFMYKHFFKRLLDVFLSLIAIVVLSPLYLVVSICVLIGMGHPILFSQERIGKNGKTFKLYKFRSMTNAKDESGNLLPEKERLTKFGIWLRSSSLDELPELFSILLGKMSFVGPRPLPVYYDPFFLPNERERHSVRGGLIPPDGLCGEETTTWEEQFEYEIYYVKNISFFLDCKVIFATFKILFKRVKNNYGADDRPHLRQYRADMMARKEDLDKEQAVAKEVATTEK